MAYEIKIETGSSIQSVEELKKQIDSLKSSLDGLNKSTAEYAKIAKQLSDAQKQLSAAQKDAAKSMKEIGSSTDTAQRNIKKTGDESRKATDNFKVMRDEIKQLRSDFAGTTAGTQEYDEALLALSNKMRDFNDMNKMIRGSAADTGQMLANFIGTTKGIAGGFEAASGALELFGVSTESLQQAEKRTLAIVKVTQGLAAAEDGLGKALPRLVNNYKTLNAALVRSLTTRKASKAATDAETVSDTAQAGASKAAATADTAQAAGNTAVATSAGAASGATLTMTGAVKALTAAIAANPLGLLLVGLTTLVSLLPAAINGLKKLFGMKKSGDTAKSIEETEQAVRVLMEKTEKEVAELQEKAKIKLEIEKTKAGDDLDPVEELELEIESAKALLSEYEQAYKDVFNNTARYSEAEAEALAKYYQRLKDEQLAYVNSLSSADNKELAQLKADNRNKKNTSGGGGKSRHQQEMEDLDKYIENLRKSVKTQTEIENDAYDEQVKNLQKALDNKRIEQEEFDKLSEQLEKKHNERLEEIEKERTEKAKKLYEDLENAVKTPLSIELERYNKELDELKKFHDEKLLSDDEFYKAEEDALKKHNRNKDKINAESTSTEISNLNNRDSQRSAQVGADYDKLIAMVDPKSRDAEIQAAELAAQKEQAIFEIKKKNIEEQIELQKKLLSSQKEGTESYQKTLIEINNLESQMTLAETEHQTAVIEGEKAKQEAIENTKEQMKAQTKAYISAANDIIDKLSDLIGMYAEEAKERSENEKLSIEARKAALEESKKYQIAQVIISTLQGIVGAWSTSIGELGPIAGPIAAAAMTALLTTTAAMNIAKIKSQQLGGSAANLSGTSNANIGIPTFNSAEANINAERPQQDIKCYVVEGEISEKQETARVRVAESTF